MSPAPEPAPRWSDPGVEQVAHHDHRLELCRAAVAAGAATAYDVARQLTPGPPGPARWAAA